MLLSLLGSSSVAMPAASKSCACSLLIAPWQRQLGQLPSPSGTKGDSSPHSVVAGQVASIPELQQLNAVFARTQLATASFGAEQRLRHASIAATKHKINALRTMPECYRRGRDRVNAWLVETFPNHLSLHDCDLLLSFSSIGNNPKKLKV